MTTKRRLSAVKPFEPPIPGDGAIEDVREFDGRLFALRGGKLYTFEHDQWLELGWYPYYMDTTSRDR